MKGLITKIKRFFISLFEKSKAVIPELPQDLPTPIKKQPDYNVKLWCPFAEYTHTMVDRGEYIRLYPQGAVVHFTAGRDISENNAINSIEWGKSQGYAYFMISPSGKIYQTISLDRWGYHCGDSYWQGLGRGLSNKLVGIEIACAGKLEPYKGNLFRSWFGVDYKNLDNTPEDQVRSVSESEYGCPSGHYKMFTKEQENSLVKLLVWLKKNNSNVFNTDFILGHHEISQGRKNDPGGSLSMPMSELRKLIKSLT